jgi:hypothetical protein
MLKRIIRPLADGYSYEVGVASEQEWYQLLRKFDDSTIHQTWAYAVLEEGRRNITPLLLKRKGEVVAAAMVRFRRLPLLGMGLAVVHRGPIWRRKGADASVEDFRQALRALRMEFVCKQGLTLRINPAIFDDETLGLGAIIEEEGFLPIVNQERVRTILMDLTPPLIALHQGMSRNWKRNLRRAEESNLEVVEGSSDNLVEDIQSIYGEMVSRKGFAASEAIINFKRLQNLLPDGEKLRIMLCRQQGALCAGLVWSAIGDTGMELIAATSDAGTQLGGSHLLRWKLIEKLKQQGAVLYDLNGISPARNPGTYRFKKDLAGSHGRDVFYLGRFDASPGVLSWALIQLRDLFKTWRKRLLR